MQQSSCHFRVAPNLCCKAIKCGAIDDDIFIVNDIWHKSWTAEMKKGSSQWTKFIQLRKAEKKIFSGFFTQLHKLCSLRRSFLDFDIFILIQIKLIFTKEVRHSASFWKWEFLELGNGLLSFKILILEKVLFSKVRKYPGGYFLVYATKWGRIFTTGLTIMGLHFYKSL